MILIALSHWFACFGRISVPNFSCFGFSPGLPHPCFNSSLVVGGFISFRYEQYVAEGTCTNTCQHSRDGYCDDPRSSGVCPSGTDCQVSLV